MQDEIAEAFQSLFRGRTDVWGGIEGIAHKEPVTPKHYERHLKGEISLGIYPLLDDGTCRWAAIDIDVKDFNKAKAVRDALFSGNIPTYIAASKSKGYHCYCFALEVFNASEIRSVLRYVLKELGIKAEIFPKQDKVTEVTPFGNYINLPCCGITRPFLTTDLKEVPIKIAIDKIKYVPQEAIERILRGIPKEPPPKEKPARKEFRKHPPCIEAILLGVSEPGRDEAAFALARYYLDQQYSPDDVLGLLKLWDTRNKPPLGDERLLEVKVRSAEKGYHFGCKSIVDNAMLSQYCVGEEECEWLKELREVKGTTIDGITYFQRGNQIFSSRPGKKEDALPIITTLTNFGIEPRLKIELEGEDERLDTTIKASKADYSILFQKSDFNSRRQLLSALPAVDLQYYGTDKDTQPLLTMLDREELPRRKGTKVLGRNADLWVVKDMVISGEGVVEDPELVYVPSEIGFDRQVSYPITKSENEIRNIKNQVIPLLLRLNKPEIILPILGWFFATPFTPLIREQLGHFPILSIYGTHGAGKSSLLRILWQLFGIKSELFSPTETPFTFLRLFSGSSTIPIIIDEFKPYTMLDKEVALLIRYLRRIYDGDIETRGRPDLSLVTYHLQAPTIISGEVSVVVSESALAERVIQVNMNPDILEGDSQYVKNFNKLSSLKLRTFAYPYIKWCLSANINELIEEAEGLLPKRLNKVPERIYDNILVMITGLVALRQFNGSLKPSEPLLEEKETFKVAINQTIDDLTTELFEETGYHKIALTAFLETLTTLAQTRRIRHGIHYTTSDNETRLYIHLPDCLAEFHKFVRETGIRVEIVDQNAYRKQAREEHERKGYVLETNTAKWFEQYVGEEGGKGKLRKAIQIDMEKLPFDTSGFKQEKTVSEAGGYGQPDMGFG